MAARVHHIINSYSRRAGGAERLVRGLHLGLMERGIDSHLLGVEAHEDDDLPAARSLGLPSCYSWRAFRGIRRYLREECRPGDIVHAHLFPCMFFAALLRGGFAGPFVVTEHSTSNRRRQTMWGGMIDRITYKACDRVICISAGTERALHEWMPSTRGRTEVILNGVRLVPAGDARRKEGRPLRVLSVGGLRAAKNYPMALRAIADLDDLDVDYRIAGAGDDETQLKQLADDLGLGERVRFLGFQDDLGALFAEADVFFIPSRWEGFGLAAVEAMNAGLPVVAGDVDGLREVVGEDGACGQLVDPASREAIAAGLRLLLTDPARRRACGEAAAARARRFDEGRMLDRYERFYVRLAGGNQD